MCRVMTTIAKSLLLGALLAATPGAGTGAAQAGLVGNDLQARVKGMVSGNWEIGLGDQVGVPGQFVRTTGPDPFLGVNT